MRQDKREHRIKSVAKGSIAEELNIEPRLRPAKTGSVAQNTARPVKPRK